jgi:hypothetical protein
MDGDPKPKLSGREKPKADAAARAARKREARAQRTRRAQPAPAASPVPAAPDATPLASRLQRIEDALSRQAQLSDDLLAKVESLVAASATAQADKAD